MGPYQWPITTNIIRYGRWLRRWLVFGGSERDGDGRSPDDTQDSDQDTNAHEKYEARIRGISNFQEPANPLRRPPPSSVLHYIATCAAQVGMIHRFVLGCPMGDECLRPWGIVGLGLGWEGGGAVGLLISELWMVDANE